MNKCYLNVVVLVIILVSGKFQVKYEHVMELKFKIYWKLNIYAIVEFNCAIRRQTILYAHTFTRTRTAELNEHVIKSYVKFTEEHAWSRYAKDTSSNVAVAKQSDNECAGETKITQLITHASAWAQFKGISIQFDDFFFSSKSELQMWAKCEQSEEITFITIFRFFALKIEPTWEANANGEKWIHFAYIIKLFIDY